MFGAKIYYILLNPQDINPIILPGVDYEI